MKSVGVGIQGLSEVSLCGAESLSSGRDKTQTLSVHRVKLPQTERDRVVHDGKLAVFRAFESPRRFGNCSREVFSRYEADGCHNYQTVSNNVFNFFIFVSKYNLIHHRMFTSKL